MRKTLIITFVFLAILFVQKQAWAQTQLPPIPQTAPYITPEIGLEEQISSFDSEIVVENDGSLNITETIKVYAAGDEIKRGIFRDFPVVVNTPYGKEIKPINIVSVTKDGEPEPFFTEQIEGGFRLYIGQENVFLGVPGSYTYKIKYEAPDQIRHFVEHDELFWNITGNFWNFPIKQTQANVIFPFKVDNDKIATVSYIGAAGSTQKGPQGQKSIQEEDPSRSKVTFSHNNELSPTQGLTIAVKFPKGFILETAQNKVLFRQYSNVMQVVYALLICATGYYIMFYLWKKHGKDQGGLPTIPVNFGPPEGLSPLEVRFIDKMGKTDLVYMSLVVLQLAIKGYVKVTTLKNNDYAVIHTQKSPNDLKGIELAVYSIMFPTWNSNVNVEQILQKLNEKKGFAERIGEIFSIDSNDDMPEVFRFNKANLKNVTQIKNSVDSEVRSYNKRFIISNTGVIARMSLISMLLIGGYILLLSIFYTLVYGSDLSYFFEYIKPNGLNLFAYVIMIGFIISISFFVPHMPRRTKQAREYQDKIEGFKIFLKSQEYYLKGLSDSIPERFNMYEKYLPFAIALDLEPVWSSKFKNEIKQMQLEQKEGVYTSWYVGNSTFSTGDFSKSFTSSVSSTMRVTSTGSSTSGFSSSGGFSGGGGGGGGGGGW